MTLSMCCTGLPRNCSQAVDSSSGSTMTLTCATPVTVSGTPSEVSTLSHTGLRVITSRHILQNIHYTFLNHKHNLTNNWKSRKGIITVKIIISKFLKHYSKAESRASAYSRVLHHTSDQCPKGSLRLLAEIISGHLKSAFCSVDYSQMRRSIYSYTDFRELVLRVSYV